MYKRILNIIGESRVKAWLMDRVQFPELGSQNNQVLREVFFRVPEFKGWLKQMQIRLLRNTLVDKKSAEQREGQILFVELLLANDTDSGIFKQTKVEPKIEKVIDKEAILNLWNKEEPNKNANDKKGSENKESHG
jgi:hypothetical protein